MTNLKFQTGDRVKMTAEAEKQLRTSNKIGVILKVYEDGHLRVKRDNVKHPGLWHPNVWELHT